MGFTEKGTVYHKVLWVQCDRCQYHVAGECAVGMMHDRPPNTFKCQLTNIVVTPLPEKATDEVHIRPDNLLPPQV